MLSKTLLPMLGCLMASRVQSASVWDNIQDGIEDNSNVDLDDYNIDTDKYESWLA